MYFNLKRSLALNWLIEIIDNIQVDKGFIARTELFNKLFNSVINAAYSDEEDVRLICAKLLTKSLQKFKYLDENILIR